MASKIEDYGFISNLNTGALVSKSGTVDWLCAPRFDSDACFAALIGYDEHGQWAIRPTVPIQKTRQHYRGDTLILETEFVCEGGAVRITDFMPTGEDRCDLVRLVEGLEGEVPLEVLIDLRFGYGKFKPWITAAPNGFLFTSGPDAVIVRAPARITINEKRASAYLQVKKGDRIPFQMTWHQSYKAPPPELDVSAVLAKTEGFWQEWAGRCTYQGQHREAVMRSLLTLKGLIYQPTGAVVAALTTSLPEALGGVRNWDYRFCWLRDASLTLDALMIGGYIDEARGFRDWLLRAVAGAPDDLQIMYDIMGGRRLTEFEIDLPGYESSRPVHIGNAASGQFQLDVYGEVLSCLYAGRQAGLAGRVEAWEPFKEVMDFLEGAWQRPDDGIWEVRGGRRHFTHSKVMAWVAFDRAVRAIEVMHQVPGANSENLLPHLRATRERIHAEVCQRGYNPKIRAFTQSYGSELLDASVLVIPHVGFLPASDPRMQGTVAAIEKDLLRDGFVLRYDPTHGADGLPGTEGAFLACSFWLADNYAFAGRMREAEELFDRLLSLRNHLGLLSEEYDPTLQRQIGNFPQAFSHLGLIFTAHVIDAVKGHGDVRSPLRAAAEAGARH